MNFSVSIKGSDKIASKLKKLSGESRSAALNAIVDGTLAIHREAIKSINAHQSKGFTYELYDPRRTHSASAPGNPPNTDLGGLIKSIQFDVDKQNNKGFVGTNLKYGAWLEFGTRTIEPRPWLVPAFDKFKQSIIENLKKALVSK